MTQPLKQEQLDNKIREAAKGHGIVVEEMVSDGPRYQQYALSSGEVLKINKLTGSISFLRQGTRGL